MEEKGWLNMEHETWIAKYEVVQSGKYEKIAKTYKGFKPFENNIIETKEAPGTTTMATYYKKSDLDNLLQLIELLEVNYLPDKEIVKMLGFEGKTPLAGVKRRKEILDGVISLCESQNIGYKYFDEGFKKVYLYVAKEHFLSFMETHIQSIAAREKYNISYEDIYGLETKYNIQRVTITKNNFFYSLKDAEKYFNIPKYNEEDFFNLDETLSIFNCSRNTIDSLRKEEHIEPVFIKGKTFYSKESVDNLLKKMAEIKNTFCTAKSVMQICNLAYVPGQLVSFPTDTLANLALGEPVMVMYFLEDVNQYKKQVEERNNLSQALSLFDPVEAFEQILTIKEISFSEKCPYTQKEWHSFCKEKLSLAKRNIGGLKSLISNYVDCTTVLAAFTLDKELFSLTSNEINLKLFNPSIAIQKQRNLYSFLLEYHGKITALLSENNKKTKTFNMSRIINPYLYETTEKPKETYEYSEYIEIYDYAKSMKHKQQAIIDAENIINRNEYTTHYASAWLYILTHLGNAWRHSDVMSLPMVELKDVNHCSLETLKERDLTLEEANSIINQVKRKDLTVNKTGATNRFNCPDDLVLPFATAAAICSLIVIEIKGIISDSENNVINNSIIDFDIQNNNVISKKAHNAFFSNFNKEDFKFQSLKMNRTVLVLIYMVLVRKGRSSAALELAQRLRAHEDFETTNIYLVIPDEELDELCESLFNRKYFGYIPSLLATVLFGDNEDRNKRTQEILALNSAFGGIQRIEATTGFINKTLSERQKVADEIFRMGLDEVTDLMFDLEVNALPSHEENFQCIVSPDCHKPELESCKDCPFAVPNFYAISSLVEGVKGTILEFIRDFEPSTFEGEKTRLMNHLYKDMDGLERAMQKFGKTEVFRFFDNGEEEYNGLLDLLDELQYRTGEDFEQYLTYNPIYLT
ncbi:hypothetical protein [Neobacillus drentensis]|uniref:hypothetical protein n=1 Tax=Neobacillus drentensis TaxID=220684 RepID=UPI003000562F